ncbi:hypothetical protein LTR17_019650 [Elasticomyces elasticus]|nr:hypothetical protein LTR17_019650 [Elasticomyces elasticus]
MPAEQVGCDKDGYDPSVMFKNKAALAQHVREVHDGRWPATCTYPRCPNADKTFPSTASVKHFLNKHGLATPEDRKPYWPTVQVWVKQRCVVGGCGHDQLWSFPKAMEQHLTGPAHNKDKAEAAQRIQDTAQKTDLKHNINAIGVKESRRKNAKVQKTG